MDQEEIDTSTKKNNFPKFTDDLEGENFENKNLNIENLREKIKLLDTTQYKIEGTSLEIITQIYLNPELLKNIIRMIVEELKKCAEQIATTDINMMAIRNMINRV